MKLASNAFAQAIVDVLAKAFASRDAHLRSLEQRLGALEQKPHVKYLGVWKAGAMYEPGDAATHGGSLWICKAATRGEPGKDFPGWTLAVKRGRS
jgi:hypothetical protein